MPVGVLKRFFGSAVSNAAGYAVGGAIQPALEPYTRDLVSAAWAAHKSMPLSPADAAEAVIRGLMSETDAAFEAASNGIGEERFGVLQGLAGDPPGPDELLELWNRGALSEADVDHGLRQGRLRNEWIGPVKQLRRALLSAGELAAAVVQGVTDAESAAAYATSLGIQREDFDRLVRLAGNPPGGEQLLDLWNRGAIAEADVDRGLRQSHLKPEWVGPVKELRNVLPSVSDLVRFAVREVYSPDVVAKFGQDQDFPAAFATEAAKRGLSREHAEQYWAAHWNLPSPTQGFEMFHRELIDQAELELLLRTLDVMPFWRDRLIKLNYRVPGRIDTRRMLQEGVITEAEATANYRHLGYDAVNAARLVQLAKTATAGGARAQTAANLRTEFEGYYINEAQLRRGLQTLGYAPAEVDLQVHLGDASRVGSARTKVVTAVERAFVRSLVTEETARQRLAEVHVDGAAIDTLIGLWQIERAVTIATLTPAQIRTALKKAVLTEAQALQELAEHGYDDAEAREFLAI